VEAGELPRRRGPLDGILVLDLTRVLAGPYCTLVLRDLGARVIKIEQPGRGDDSRAIGPFDADGRSAYFASLNRGKESLALDLKAPADRALFEELLARADVLVENFRPGVMERLGLGAERLAARHPRLVYASVSGFGRTGPDAQLPAYDIVVQALGGVMSLTGQPGSPPTRVGTSIGDIAAGLFTAIGIQAALFERAASGCGRLVDVAMLDCQVAILENAIARYQTTGQVPGPIGSRHPSITPFQSFRTRDGFCVIAAGNDALFAALAGVLGVPALAADPRYATNELRTRNVDALAHEIERALVTEATSVWLARLREAGIPCAPVQNVAEVMAHPQVRARNMVVALEGSRGAHGAPLEIAGNPIKLSGFEDPTARPPAPALDADRERILAWLAEPGGAPA
jgi:CoA:oxalate CoA-transferase